MVVETPFGEPTQIHGLTAVEIRQCHLGHAAPVHPLWEKDGFTYYQCTQCGLVWVNPQLSDESVAYIYSTAFTGRNLEQRETGSFLAYQRLLNNLEPYKHAGGRLLDVGTFTGNLLLAAREAGWQHVEGTEINTQASAFARENNALTMHEGDLLNLTLPANAYDAITLSDVIEHVSQPIPTLHRIYDLLRPGGILFMDTPHFRSVPRWLFGKEWTAFFPWHRTLFSVSNMQEALETAGFRVKYIAAVGVLPFSRRDAWAGFQQNAARKSNPAEPPAAPPAGWRAFIGRHKQTLRPLWISAKHIHELPFQALSAAGIHIGAKLIAYAEKPD